MAMSTQPVADLSEINPHLALLASESYVSPGERAWYRWVATVERLLGHGLDGNEHTDGFSLDYAYAAFDANECPADYVMDVRIAKARLEDAFGPHLSLPAKSSARRGRGARGTAY